MSSREKEIWIVLLIAAVLISGAWFYLHSKNTGKSQLKKDRNIVAFCGSASKPALDEAASSFENKTGNKVELHFSGSGTMLSRMKMSERGDLYIPGSPDYMARAIRENVVQSNTVRKIAYLVPAIVTPTGNPENISKLSDLGKEDIKVGIGDPESVCVGEYAVEVLKKANLYSEVENNIVVFASSCSQTANLAVWGKVDAVIGWRVFHHWNKEKTELIYLEPEQIPKIAYVPVAISNYVRRKNTVKKFVDYLTSSEGKDYFWKYGYIPTEDNAREFAPNASILNLSK